MADEACLHICGARRDKGQSALVGERPCDLRLARARRAIKQCTLGRRQPLLAQGLDMTQRLANTLQLVESLRRQDQRVPARVRIDGFAARLDMPLEGLAPHGFRDKAAILAGQRADIGRQPREVATGEAGAGGTDEDGNLRRPLELLHLQPQDLQPLGSLRQADLDVGAEARSDGIVQQVFAVGGADDPDTLIFATDAVPFGEKRLHELLGGGVGVRAAATGEYPFTLIDEDHAPPAGASLLPDLLHALAALADVTRLQVRALQRQKEAAGRIGDAARDLRLAGSRGAIQ